MDEVVLLSEDRARVGILPKSQVHSAETPLHLAFSCYVLDREGRVLVTRRSLSKQTWPGVWTNSFCGHPRPDESMTDAVMRRGRQELGIDPAGIRLALADYRYRAVDASGIVENEVCPVHVARFAGDVVPDPDEVMEFAWVDPEALIQAVALAPFAYSPWMREQLPLLRERGEL